MLLIIYISSIDEAKQLIKNSRSERIEINKQRKEVLELQRELNHLETIKEEKLSSSNLYIHNIKFGGNRIDYKNSNDKEFCVNLPYKQAGNSIVVNVLVAIFKNLFKQKYN